MAYDMSHVTCPMCIVFSLCLLAMSPGPLSLVPPMAMYLVYEDYMSFS